MFGVGLKSGAPMLLSSCLSLLIFFGITCGHANGAIRVVSREGDDAVLPCSIPSKENLVPKLFDWRKDGQNGERPKEVFLYDAGIHYNNGHTGQDEQFKGRVSHFQDDLQRGNASIIIRNTKMADSGSYTCAFPRLQPPRVVHIELVVEPMIRDRSGEIPGAAPEPCIKILDATEDWSLLQCEVRGASPKPEVEFVNSAGKPLSAEKPRISQRGDLYNVTVVTKVTKTDRYRCVATQEETGHRISAETYVFVYEKHCEDSSTKQVIGWFGGGLVLGAGLVVLIQCLLKIKKGAHWLKYCYSRGSPTGPPVVSSNDSSPDSPLKPPAPPV